MSQQPVLSHPVLASLLLAFTAGYVDTVGFVGLFGLFTAHVTGNFVMIGAALVARNPGIIVKLLALPVFIAAVALSRLWVMYRARGSRPFRTHLIIAQAFLLSCFLAAAVAGAPFAHPDAPVAMLTGFLGVAAMGVQNAAARLSFGTMAPTTVMTGNVTQAVIDAIDLLAGHPAPDEARERFRKMWPPVLAFAVGALLGAAGYIFIGFAALAAPIVALVVLAVLSARAT